MIHALDEQGNSIGLTIAQDCIIFIHGVEPEQEHTISIETTVGVTERTEFIGERPKREER